MENNTRSHHVCVYLSEAERRLLLAALSAASLSDPAVSPLRAKLSVQEPNPFITVRVYGGLVQAVDGNPFPIRVCDYDGKIEDNPDLDEHGRPCTVIDFDPQKNVWA